MTPSQPQTPTPTPVAGQEVIKSNRTIFDLDKFDEVTLIKTATFTPAATASEALTRLGGDADKFLAIINKGLQRVAVESLAGDQSIPFHVVNEDGEIGDVWNGSPADMKAVNALQLALAKNVFGYEKEKPLEAKRAAKDAAMEMIRTSEAMKNGLKTNAKAQAE